MSTVRGSTPTPGETFPVVDPATGETIVEVPRLGTAETRRAIEAAARAFPAWGGLLAKDPRGSCVGSRS
jgi:succinate-semialdehyde dehydrogenase/glutarate-semialdehyde dehydrogenase